MDKSLSWKAIIAFLICLHLIFAGFMLWQPHPTTVVMKKNLFVKTIQLQPLMIHKEQPPNRVATPLPTSSPKPPLPARNPSPSKKSSPLRKKKPSASIPEALRRELARSFAALEQAPPSSPLLSLEEKLVAALQHALRLPDYGEVKVQLTLHSDGSVAKVNVYRAESEKNRAYLEAHLPHLNFADVLGKRKNQDDITVSIAFCNAL